MSCGPGHCITCGDDGAHASVEIALVEPVSAGDTLLVHAATALAHLAQEPAA